MHTVHSAQCTHNRRATELHINTHRDTEGDVPETVLRIVCSKWVCCLLSLFTAIVCLECMQMAHRRQCDFSFFFFLFIRICFINNVYAVAAAVAVAVVIAAHTCLLSTHSERYTCRYVRHLCCVHDTHCVCSTFCRFTYVVWWCVFSRAFKSNWLTDWLICIYPANYGEYLHLFLCFHFLGDCEKCATQKDLRTPTTAFKCSPHTHIHTDCKQNTAEKCIFKWEVATTKSPRISHTHYDAQCTLTD